MREPNFLQKKAIENPRIAGGIMLAIGLYFSYLFIYEPYIQLLSRESEVKVMLSGTIIGILLTILGAIFLIYGNKYAGLIFMNPTDLSKTAKIKFYGIVSVLIGGSFLLFFTWLNAHGYQLY